MKRFTHILLIIICIGIFGCDKKKKKKHEPFNLTVDAVHVEGTVSDNFSTISSMTVADNAVSVTAGQFSADVDTTGKDEFDIKASDEAVPENTASKKVEVR